MTDRLAALRAEIKAMGVDGVIIPRGDAFSGEEVPAADERLAFISGFTGSAGIAIVMADQAVLFSDGRYTIQMETETGPEWQCLTQPEASLSDWLLNHAAGKVIGFDAWLMPVGQRERLEKAMDGQVSLTPLDANPVDRIWPDKPPRPLSRAIPYSIEYAGMTRDEKITACIDRIQASHPDVRAMMITDPAGLAWLLNARGRDLNHTPVVLAFAVLSRDGTVTILADPERFADIDASGLAFADPAEPGACLSQYGEGEVMIDPSTCPTAIEGMVKGSAIHAESPITALKAIKTGAELKAFNHAHRIDAVAMVRFLHWLDKTLPERPVREVEVDQKLIEFRSLSDEFISPSFATICGGGGNGAIVHYRAVEGKDQPIPMDSLCLIDSGGQYLGATTDITRTIAAGTPSAEMIHAFTYVLKAHIALARCRFPEGTNGIQLDAITRAPLWQAGLDFAHGTGHGVGCSLSVHEGPTSISKRSTRAIEAGMVLSNEPGFYQPGGFGIRIENLIAIQRDDSGMLYAENLTFVPIDRRLIRADLLDGDERSWLDAYHRRVRDEIAPLLKARVLSDDDAALSWLIEATEPLA